MIHRFSACVPVASICVVLAVSPSAAALTMNNVVVTKVESLTESNGDIDGFLDTNETAEIVFSLANKSNLTFANFSVRLRSLDPRIDALGTGVQHILSLGPGATVNLAPITLHVNAASHRAGPAVSCENPGPAGTCSNFVVVPGGCASAAACERSIFQDYTARLQIEALGAPFGGSGDKFGPPLAAHLVPDLFEIDLDLNSVGPAVATTTAIEGFEGGFGSLTLQNLDASKATNALSDGYRCQYSDPDYPNSNSFGETECYLGFSAGQNPINDWHVHGPASPDLGRSFLGSRSLHYGKHDGATDTIALSQLDAARLRFSTQLAARICRDDPATDPRSCNSSADCASFGGACVPARPQLSFKQQIDDFDGEVDSLPYGAPERAVVQVLVQGSTTWRSIFPSVNVYNALGTDAFTNCRFDPIDDGNDEDDFFNPADPNRLFGPSSTCYPAFVFSSLGSTEGPFDASDVGQASDGPGLQGATGPGTWVESRFDLSRYRGRSIQFRFLYTSIKVSDSPSFESLFMWNPTPYDDGWYIDDVRLLQTTGTTASTVSVDMADNTALPGANDADGDGSPNDFDCASSDAGAFAIPPEVFALLAPDKTSFAWESAAAFAGPATVHDVLRGSVGEWPVGAGAAETCLATGIAGGFGPSGPAPPAGSGFYFLVRARNVCGSGSYGYTSSGGLRISAACP